VGQLLELSTSLARFLVLYKILNDMRTLLVSMEDGEIGGVNHVIGNLARYLKQQGHEVFFLHPSESIVLKRKITKSGFPGFQLRMQPPRGQRHPIVGILAFLILFPVAMYQLIRLIQRYRIQVINIHYPDDCFFYFGLCRRLLSVGLVTSVHGADVFPEGRRRARYSRAFRFLLFSSTVIIAPSAQFRKDFLHVFPELEQKSIFIHNGVNLAEINGLGTATSNGNEAPYVLCITAFKEQKAIDVLVRAFDRVQGTIPLLKLVLVGTGPLREQMEALAVSLGIREQIEFLGAKGRAEVVKLLLGCKVFVLPSRFETFGIAILEAMACKKPVVATMVGGIPEIIENKKNGLLVQPDDSIALADALIAVLTDQVLQRTIATNGYVTAHERFRAENTGASYEAVFLNSVNCLAANSRVQPSTSKV
jgi:L-malate glycosyltransferase